MCLDEAGISRNALQVLEDRIESLDMADLQQSGIVLRQPHEFLRFGSVVGHWFFHEHMLALGEELAGDLEMGVGRGDDTERLSRGYGLGHRRENSGSMTLRDFFRGLDGYIKNADQFDAAAPGQVRIDARMLLSERTGAEHRDLDLWQHGRGSFGLAEVRGKSAVRRIKKAGKSGVAEHTRGYDRIWKTDRRIRLTRQRAIGLPSLPGLALCGHARGRWNLRDIVRRLWRGGWITLGLRDGRRVVRHGLQFVHDELANNQAKQDVGYWQRQKKHGNAA